MYIQYDDIDNPMMDDEENREIIMMDNS